MFIFELEAAKDEQIRTKKQNKKTSVFQSNPAKLR